MNSGNTLMSKAQPESVYVTPKLLRTALAEVPKNWEMLSTPRNGGSALAMAGNTSVYAMLPAIGLSRRLPMSAAASARNTAEYSARDCLLILRTVMM
jgi:hypothetical protein